MNRFRMVALGLGLALLAACASTPRVSVDHNPDFDFAAKTRFAVLRPEAAVAAMGGRGAPVMNDLMAQRLTRTIQTAMTARGFQMVSPAEADMFVTFFVTTENRTDIHTYNTGFGYGRCWDRFRCAGWANPEVSVQQYQMGTLFIDFIDPQSGVLQWRGTTSTRLPSNPSQEKRDETANRVVTAIIDQFPPGHVPAR